MSDESSLADESSLPDDSSSPDSEPDLTESRLDESAAKQTESAADTESTADNSATDSEDTGSSKTDDVWHSIDINAVTEFDTPGFGNVLVQENIYDVTGYEPIDEITRDLRILKVNNVEYKGNELRITYIPYLSDISNFTAYDPNFESAAPTLTRGKGFTDEYSVDGTLSINGDTVVMDFKGVKEAANVGNSITVEQSKLNDEYILSCISDGNVKYNDMRFCELFEVTLPGYVSKFTDDNCLSDTAVGISDLKATIGFNGTEPINPLFPVCFFRHVDNTFYIDDNYGINGVLKRISRKELNSFDKAIISSDSARYTKKNGVIYYNENYNGTTEHILLWVDTDHRDGRIELLDNTTGYGFPLELLINAHIVLGNGCEGFYNQLISVFNPASSANDTVDLEPLYDEIECENAKIVLNNLKNPEQYSKTGTIEEDIELMKNGEYYYYAEFEFDDDFSADDLPVDDGEEPDEFAEDDVVETDLANESE